MTKRFHYPTADELHAIETAARRAQIKEMFRLARLGAKSARELVVRAATAIARVRRRPATVARHSA
ncbi:MAG: hypothetical protein AMJ67_07375 [Betaproteobacteria bacterium SG8_41]|nr:MAG: hypothetical protein AMJ67_07375 [Betaproteobacteria bacterium SG8_41]